MSAALMLLCVFAAVAWMVGAMLALAHRDVWGAAMLSMLSGVFGFGALMAYHGVWP